VHRFCLSSSGRACTSRRLTPKRCRSLHWPRYHCTALSILHYPYFTVHDALSIVQLTPPITPPHPAPALPLPIPQSIFAVDGVKGVFFSRDVITVTKVRTRAPPLSHTNNLCITMPHLHTLTLILYLHLPSHSSTHRPPRVCGTYSSRNSSPRSSTSTAGRTRR
jgi:hypothetical protein